MRGDSPTRAAESHGGGHDMTASAFDIYKHLDSLTPVHIPPLRYFPEPEVLKKWRFGNGTIPEHLKADFANWLESAAGRSDRIAENQRRLRATMWAEAFLRGVGETGYSDSLAEFHRTAWRIGEQTPDTVHEREAIVRAVVEALAKGGGR
jgi:hypothetical protein